MVTIMAPRTALLTSSARERMIPIIWKTLRGLEVVLVFFDFLASAWELLADFFGSSRVKSSTS